MYPLIELWMTSDQTQQWICEEYNIKPHTFNYWRSKYRKENEEPIISKKDASGFVPIKVGGERQSPCAYGFIQSGSSQSSTYSSLSSLVLLPQISPQGSVRVMGLKG